MPNCKFVIDIAKYNTSNLYPYGDLTETECAIAGIFTWVGWNGLVV